MIITVANLFNWSVSRMMSFPFSHLDFVTLKYKNKCSDKHMVNLNYFPPTLIYTVCHSGNLGLVEGL